MLAAAAFVLTSAFAVLPEAAQAELKRCGVDAAELDRLLALDEQAFDQDQKGGWRAIKRKDGCGKAAGEAIKAYILYSVPTPPRDHEILRWHAGQALAIAGFEQEALPFFRGSYGRTGKEEGGKKDAYDYYIDATIAFIENDEEALLAAREALAAFVPSEEEQAFRRKFLADNPNITMPEGFVDQPQNMTVVDDLIACFGKPYGETYGSDCRLKDRRDTSND